VGGRRHTATWTSTHCTPPTPSWLARPSVEPRPELRINQTGLKSAFARGFNPLSEIRLGRRFPNYVHRNSYLLI
jgi:hypothetical protein